MKTIFFALPLALSLAACQTYGNDPYGDGGYGNGPYGYPPAPAPYPQPYPGPNPYPQPYPGGSGAMAPYHAVGTEPGWSLDIDSREMRFSGSYGDNPITQPTPPVTIGVAGEIYDTPRLNVNIVHGQCSDGMSDRSYPDRVEVRADGRLFRGCGGADGYGGYGLSGRDSPGYDGPPPGTGIGTLAETNWRVTSIDGVRVPNSNYYVNFLPDRIAAKFGCNSIGATYSTKANMLTLGAPLTTRMACADMGFENKATRIMAVPLRVDLSNPEMMILTNGRGTIELSRVH